MTVSIFLNGPEIEELEQNEGIVLKYSDNPNGSIRDIAGFAQKTSA